MPPRQLRLGTRQSALALAQSGLVARALEGRIAGLNVELVPIVTRGDRWPGDLAEVGGKGWFTEELEADLLADRLDLAVHSLKDLPVTLPQGLAIAAFPPRADARDVLVSDLADDLAGLPAGSVLLTGSLRRRAQILRHRPDLVVEPVRGNVDTRLEKWRSQKAAGVILAAAGLARLGVGGIPAHPLPPAVVQPAPGQGTLAIEVRAGSPAEDLCRRLNDPETALAAAAERAVVAAFGGDCTLPLSAWARREESTFRLDARLTTPDGRREARGGASTAAVDPASLDLATLADACVAALRKDGAEDVLRALGRAPLQPS
ncbi:MAG: hydroxymethylbilane synthase [Acidobacteriota bacterium]